MELGAGMGIGPGGFEPPYPDPKSGVLPLDEGPARLWPLNLQTSRYPWKTSTVPLLSPTFVNGCESRSSTVVNAGRECILGSISHDGWTEDKQPNMS